MDLKPAELGLLVALDAMLETESVSAAARRLGVSQPAMSAQLARLRRLFNDPLFTPVGRRFSPTARALALRAPLKARLRDLEALVRQGAVFDPATTEATFSVIGTDYVHAALAPRLIERVAKEAPGARVALLPFDAEGYWRALELGRADLGLVTANAPADARARDALREDFVVIQRTGHPRGAGSLTLDAFCAAEHILVSPQGGGFVGAVDAALQERGLTRRVVCSAPSFLLAPALVERSDRLCVLPRRFAESLETRVDRFELPFPSPGFRVRMLWHPRLQDEPGQIWFRRLILEEVRAV